MSSPSKSKFLITLASVDDEKKLSDNKKRPFPSNFIPLEIRVQRSARKKDPMAQECKYISSKETKYSDDGRCYIQIWELDTWTVEKKKAKKKEQDEDPSAKSSAQNDFLAEFSGFIIEIRNGERKEYKFITDGKETTILKADPNKKLGKIILRIDELKDSLIKKRDITVPIQGEAESILEIGVVYQEKPGQKTYADNYSRPVYHIFNISKIVEEQLKEGGLIVICYVQLERTIDTKAYDFYRKIRKLISKEKQKDKELFPSPEAPKFALNEWLDELDRKDKIPSEANSKRNLYNIQNDFKYASGHQEGKFKPLCVDEEGRIAVGRVVLVEGKNEIVANIRDLINAVHKQHMESKGEKPKVLKLGIYCHGMMTKLMTGGRNKDDKTEKYDYGRKTRGDIKKDNVDDFVKKFIVKEEGKDRKLLAENVLFALYACSTGRSSFTNKGIKFPNGKTIPPSTSAKVDNTFGKDLPPGMSLGEGSFARALRDKLHLDGRFPKACVFGHTTAGTAEANPKIRLFSADGEVDKVGLAKKERETIRDTMFTLP